MLGLAERRVCRVLGQSRSTQRYQRQPPDDEPALTQAIIGLASQYGRYGYRQVTGMLRNDGWRVNHKRVERIWRREGLKVPKKQPPPSATLADGWLLYPAPGGASQSCLGVRLHGHPHRGRTASEAADDCR